MNNDRYILVIADGSKEMEVALLYACARSKKTNRKIIIATFIEPLDVLTTKGVTEFMQNEAREEAEKKIKYASSIVKKSTGITPVLHIREGEIMSELKSLIEEEENISFLEGDSSDSSVEENHKKKKKEKTLHRKTKDLIHLLKREERQIRKKEKKIEKATKLSQQFVRAATGRFDL